MTVGETSTVWRRVGAAVVALAVAVVLASSWGALPASAEGDAEEPARFIGFVGATEDGLLPVRLRATDASGLVVCGTAEVTPSTELVGFYVLEVASGAVKEGCPSAGEAVRFRLLYGAIDENLTAAQEGVFVAGETQVLHLSPGGAEVTSGFVGAVPAEGGFAILQWAGADGTPVEQALATLGAPVSGIWWIDPEGRWASFIPGAPDFTQTYLVVGSGDLVLVRVVA